MSLQVLAKIGERLGDVQVQVPPPGAAAAAAGAAAAASAGRPAAADVPDIDNLIDAAKYGDLEAVEDFIAIGKVCVFCGGQAGAEWTTVSLWGWGMALAWAGLGTGCDALNPWRSCEDPLDIPQQ
jgi:hypothetical protein